MHLDYRCYIKFRNSDTWERVMGKLSAKDTTGEEHSFLEIADIFADPRQLERAITEPIGEIFDVLTSNKELAFSFIHDHKKLNSIL